ncbi:MAG: DUF177 domain-containing protein [Desulfomonilaceae bacterium]|nr:DUF177 domain-containing protein [Desulfomonilaceae bacterium]
MDEIPEEGLDLVFSDEDVPAPVLADLQTPQGGRMAPRLSGHVRLFESGENLLLSVRIQARMHLSCFRCLREFDSDHEIEMDVIVRRKDKESPGDDEVVDSGANEVWTEGPELDLGTLLAQELLLEMPMKPLCSQDCAGLCPRCGALKGSDQCTCREEHETDPRWHALAKLKDRAGR